MAGASVVTPARTSLHALDRCAAAAGLTLRGAFHPDMADIVPTLPDGSHPRTLVLLGFAGARNWDFFRASPEASDRSPEPLDRWSRRVIDGLARAFCAAAVFPFPTDRPPYHPFQRWALAADTVHSSPIKMLIHPDWGLWHSYRGALLLRKALRLPKRAPRANPCDSCTQKPCLTACLVNALDQDAFATEKCVRHIASPDGADCLELGCRARRACPVGAHHRYEPREAAFHMHAFRDRHHAARDATNEASAAAAH